MTDKEAQKIAIQVAGVISCKDCPVICYGATSYDCKESIAKWIRGIAEHD